MESKCEETREVFVGGTKFVLSKRYQVIKPIGTGAYGVVISAFDHKTGEKVAIKKIPNAFDDLIDAKRILREIKLLRHFSHENIISMKDILKEHSLENFNDVYIVTDLMETDLHRIIYSGQHLTDDHIQYFIYQLLRSLKYMHSAGVLHRDLKPSNLLLNANCDLKVCDFGLARGVNDEMLDLTEYVVTRWYRAPEIMLSCQQYTYAIDVWSVGCILGELLQGKPMFPGDDYIQQLKIICDRLGTPSDDDLSFIKSARAKRFIQSQPYKPAVDFNLVFANANPLAVDLLQRMLVFSPAKRITVTEALTHPYMASLANIEDEPICEDIFKFEYENEDLSKEMLQELIWEEMAKFHPESSKALRQREKDNKLAIRNLRRKIIPS